MELIRNPSVVVLESWWDCISPRWDCLVKVWLPRSQDVSPMNSCCFSFLFFSFVCFTSSLYYTTKKNYYGVRTFYGPCIPLFNEWNFSCNSIALSVGRNFFCFNTFMCTSVLIINFSSQMHCSSILFLHWSAHPTT